MFGWLNVGSFVLGLIAWILPVVNLSRYEQQGPKSNWVFLLMMSISACSISLCFQIFYIYYKVTVEDWGALMDTMYAVAFAATILLIVTILLNAITLFVYRNRTAKS